ncbi:tetratricopeptide repeat protein [Novipirellula sp. SH528]|uniref:tetratricopeptide repeat protein n=1 Tax=Novipirellula sp. SH528 TaxID=3454466 RepID=UPI003FA074EC
MTLATSGCDSKTAPPALTPPTQTAVVAQLPAVEPEKDPSVWREEAATALQSGDVSAASHAIRAAVAAAPEDPQNVFFLAIVLGAEHRFPEAIRVLDRLAVAVPETRLPALGQTAEWMVIQGHYSQAESRYRELLDLVPDAIMAHRQLAILLVRQGHRLEAANHLQKMCQQGNIEEIELRILLNLAVMFSKDAKLDEWEPIGPLGQSRYEMSQSHPQNAIADLSSLPVSHSNEAELLGRIYAQLQDFDKLAAWSDQYLQSPPKTADGWFALGTLRASQDDPETAACCFCEVVIQDQTDQQAYASLSIELEKLNLLSESKLAADRAASIRRTQSIGDAMAESDVRDPKQLSELVRLLDELKRPFESLAWQAVQLAYAQSQLSETQAKEQMTALNARHLQLLQQPNTDAPLEFVVCGVDIVTLREKVKSKLDPQPVLR